MNAIGVDIAKHTIVAFVNHKAMTLPNERKALGQWLSQLPSETQIGLESTGRYGELLAHLAYERGLTVFLISPKRIKKFKESIELRGKTDPLDAEMITLYVQECRSRLHPWSPFFRAKGSGCVCCPANVRSWDGITSNSLPSSPIVPISRGIRRSWSLS
jgi:transposase